MSIFEQIRKQKQTGTGTKTTAGVVGKVSDRCPICNDVLELAYSKGIPVKVCLKHNIALPEIKED